MKTQHNRLHTTIILAVIVLISFGGKTTAWSQTKEASQVRHMSIGSKDGGKPLFILDGVLIDEKEMGQINPADIQEISVLKDKSATAIYGEKGKNGVVVITTKKPKSKSGFVDIDKAYILKDGKEISSKEFHRLDRRMVDTIITIVDTLAVPEYGDKAKFGAIIVQSKAGASEDDK